MSIFIFLKLIGSLALLMYGMKTMSEALQKLTGGHKTTIRKYDNDKKGSITILEREFNI